MKNNNKITTNPIKRISTVVLILQLLVKRQQNALAWGFPNVITKLNFSGMFLNTKKFSILKLADI